jgi:hypothetical protein
MGFMIFGISEPERPAGLRKVQFPLSLTELKRLGLAYWLVIVVATVALVASAPHRQPELGEGHGWLGWLDRIRCG